MDIEEHNKIICQCTLGKFRIYTYFDFEIANIFLRTRTENSIERSRSFVFIPFKLQLRQKNVSIDAIET